MRKEYYKLVRDRAPEIILKTGRTLGMSNMNDAFYSYALLDKLEEEAIAARKTKGESTALIRELADLFEVIDTILDVFSINREDVVRTQSELRRKFGGFEDRINLWWIE